MEMELEMELTKEIYKGNGKSRKELKDYSILSCHHKSYGGRGFQLISLKLIIVVFNECLTLDRFV
jgi:hypothetical protein